MIEQRLRNLVISGFGSNLRKEGDLIKVISKEDNKTLLISPNALEQVIISGECSITSGLVRLLIEKEVDLVFIGRNPRLFGRVMRGDTNSFSEIWRMQLLMSEDKKLEIAKEIINSTIHNKIRLLQSLAKNRGADISDIIRRLNKHIKDIKNVENIEKLMGFEGDSTRIYFEGIRRFIPDVFEFEKREKHPPKDPVNSMLGYGYTVLKSRCEYALFLSGLNPYEGILHSTYKDRAALSFDLMEEFRQPIVDRVVMTMIAKKQISVEDFKFTEEGCFIEEEGKKLFLDLLYTRFEKKYKYGGKELPFLDIIIEQAKKLANAVKNNEKYAGFKYI